MGYTRNGIALLESNVLSGKSDTSQHHGNSSGSTVTKNGIDSPSKEPIQKRAWEHRGFIMVLAKNEKRRSKTKIMDLIFVIWVNRSLRGQYKPGQQQNMLFQSKKIEKFPHLIGNSQRKCIKNK